MSSIHPLASGGRHLLLLTLALGCFQSALAQELPGGFERIGLCISKIDSNEPAKQVGLFGRCESPRIEFVPTPVPFFRVPVVAPSKYSKRTAYFYKPPGIQGKAPLVMNLHALGANAPGHEILTGFKDTAEEHNFMLVYPEGMTKAKIATPLPAPPGVPSYSWNAGGCCSYRPDDDMLFLKKLIEYLKSNYNPDEERIYVTGMSNGGFMTNRVACEMSDVIAAAVPVAGVLMEKYTGKDHPMGWNTGQFTCNPENRVPLLHFHSSEDTVVPFAGSAESNGAEGLHVINSAPNDAIKFILTGVSKFIDPKELGFPSVENSVGAWKKFNNVQNIGEETTYGDGTKCTLYNTPIEGYDNNFAPVGLCVTNSKKPEGLEGHCWPGKGGIGRCDNDGVDNEYIWKFLSQYKRERGGESDEL